MIGPVALLTQYNSLKRVFRILYCCGVCVKVTATIIKDETGSTGDSDTVQYVVYEEKKWFTGTRQTCPTSPTDHFTPLTTCATSFFLFSNLIADPCTQSCWSCSLFALKCTAVPGTHPENLHPLHLRWFHREFTILVKLLVISVKTNSENFVLKLWIWSVYFTCGFHDYSK